MLPVISELYVNKVGCSKTWIYGNAPDWDRLTVFFKIAQERKSILGYNKTYITKNH